MSLRRATTLLVLAAMLAGGCDLVGEPTDRITVKIDGEPWIVLLAGREGMRDRDSFDGADGMLFDVDEDVEPGAAPFVMDRVRFPLDIAWFRDDGRLVGIASMPMCAAEPCPRHRSPGPFRWAVEGPPGAFADLAADARLEIRPG